MFDPRLNGDPVRFPELLEDEDKTRERDRRYPVLDQYWRDYEDADMPYGDCYDGLMEWLCERDGMLRRSWTHVL